MINSEARDGWEFCQLGDVNIEVSPGCIAALFGSQVSYIRFDQVIFRRAAEGRTEADLQRPFKEQIPTATSELARPKQKSSTSQAASDLSNELSAEAIAVLQRAKNKGYQVHFSPDKKSVTLASGGWQTSFSSEAEIIKFGRDLR